MERRQFLGIWVVVTLMIAALSLGPSFAHVLEAPSRLTRWPPELWREATVFHGQFAYFAIVGAPLDVLAVLAPAILTYCVRRERQTFRPALLGCLFYALALILWFAWVNPENHVLATWTPGPLPADAGIVIRRWESGHMAVAFAKLIGFVCLARAGTMLGAPPGNAGRH